VTYIKLYIFKFIIRTIQASTGHVEFIQLELGKICSASQLPTAKNN